MSPELIERLPHHIRDIDIWIVDLDAIQPYLVLGERSHIAGWSV
jgi:hypothetical protein